MQDTEFIKHIGKIIRFYRLKNNLTQEQLSEYADCSCGFIGQIERGESKISLSVGHADIFLDRYAYTPSII